MPHSAQQKGFTLVEIMVVVVIIALMTGISVLAIQQATRRPALGQAERLQVWLQDLAERASLQGSAHGVKWEQSGPGARRLEPMVYYRQRWYPLSEPAAFILAEDATLSLPGEEDVPVDALAPQTSETELPDLVLHAAGMLPDATLRLHFAAENLQFSYHWDAESASLSLNREAP